MSTLHFEPGASEDVACPRCTFHHPSQADCPQDLSGVRPDWDRYWLDIVKPVAKRADCRRRQAGSLIVVDNRIVATGYNGVAPGKDGCLKGACPRGLLSYDQVAAHSSYETGPGRCIATHSEVNAIINATIPVVGGTIYMTPGSPCSGCMKVIESARLHRVVWESPDGSSGDSFLV